MPARREQTIPPDTYLVECYWPGVTRAAVGEAIARAHAAAAEISGTGRHVRLVHSTFVAGDEAVLSIFEAVSAQAVREASERAGLSVDRISLADLFSPHVIPSDNGSRDGREARPVEAAGTRPTIGMQPTQDVR